MNNEHTVTINGDIYYKADFLPKPITGSRHRGCGSWMDFSQAMLPVKTGAFA